MLEHIIRTPLVVVAVGIGALTCSFAWAQEDGSEDLERSRTSVLEEIIVTAQKRTENLQDVPLAVSAVNAKQIEQSFSRDISEIGALSPNLVIDPLYGVASASIGIRGIQLNDGEKSFDPAVAVYLDGVYLATNTGALLTTFDADAVEVLRGPQGTLFGRNTIGGLVHVRRKEPTGEWGGKLVATYGRFDQFDLKGVVNLPSVADGALSAKLGFVSLNDGGYFDNVTRNTQEGDNDFMMYSLGVKFEPNDIAKVVLRYDYIDDETNTRPVTALTAQGEAFCFGVFGPIDGCGRPMSDADFHRHPNTAFVQPQSFEGHSLIVNGNFEIADGHSLHAILGYRDSEESSVQKFDGTAAPLFYLIRPQEQDQTSLELRYQAELERAKIVAGGIYYESSYTNNQRTWFFGANPPIGSSEQEVLDLLAGGTLPAETPGFDATQDVRNYAVFGQVDWALSDRLTLSVGGRYTKERKEICGGNALGTPDNRSYVSTFGACPQELRIANVYQEFATNPVTGETYLQEGREEWSRFTPRIGLDYKFDTAMVYATYSEGFRSGGYNGRPNNAFNLGPYDPEDVENIEIGFKSQFADNRVRLNFSAFQADYSNKQEDVVFPDPVAVTVTVVQNAAKATIRGFEAELQAVPVEGLTLGLNIGHIDGEFDDWQDIGFNLDPATSGATPFVTIDKSNFKLRRAPDWTVDAMLNYEHELAGGAGLIFDLKYRWKDDYYIIANTVTFADPHPGLVKSFGLLDASVSYDAESWRVSLWGKNLTDEDYFQHSLDVGTSFGALPNDPTPVPIAGLWTYGTIAAPRTYGIDVQIKF